MAKRKTSASKSKKSATRKPAQKSAAKAVKSAARTATKQVARTANKTANKTAKKGSARKTAALIGGGLAAAIAGTLARSAVRSLAKSAKKPAASAAQKGKWVYSFGGGRAEGKPDQRNLLGGKGAGLAEMANLGLPVPPGFTITTEVCTYYYAHDKQYPKDLEAQVTKALAEVGRITGKVFGDRDNPLLVSVRSGARASMPGMMDTVLNLGLNDETVAGLATASGDERFAWDSYRRFIQMFSDVVLGLAHHLFEDALEIAKEDRGYFTDVEMTAETVREMLRTPVEWYMHLAVETSKHVRVSLRDIDVPTTFVAGRFPCLSSLHIGPICRVGSGHS